MESEGILYESGIHDYTYIESQHKLSLTSRAVAWSLINNILLVHVSKAH